MTHNDILTPEGKIRLYATRPDHWPKGNEIALGTKDNYDLMWTDIMPVFFWTDMLPALWAEIGDCIGGSSFASAYAMFNRELYSQMNIIGNWALQHEPEQYELVLLLLPEHSHGRYDNVATLGSHKTHGYCSHPDKYRKSCAITFGGARSRTGHDMWVQMRVSHMSLTHRLSMQQACEKYNLENPA